MKKMNLTKTEADYKRFNIIINFVLYGVFTIATISGILFVFASTEEAKALFGALMSFGIAVILFIAPKIAKKRSHYLEILRNERNAVVRTGIFKEAYDAYEHDGFKFNLTYDKWLFEDYYNNTIDIGVKKNGHEFLIEIDEQRISIVVDQEKENPIEATFALSEIDTIELLYQTINDYIVKKS